jgi:hypothetical protein
MRRLAFALLGLALAVWVFGAVRWVSLGSRIERERQQQAGTARVELNLSRQEVWQTADYTPRRAGLYSLILETRGKSWQPHPTATFTGSLQIEIVDPLGNLAKRLRMDGRSLHHTNENHIHWSALDTVPIVATGVGAWKIRALVLRADANFNETISAVILQPPAQFDVGWAEFSRAMEVAVIAGFGLILLAASGALFYFSRRR